MTPTHRLRTQGDLLCLVSDSLMADTRGTAASAATAASDASDGWMAGWLRCVAVRRGSRMLLGPIEIGGDLPPAPGLDWAMLRVAAQPESDGGWTVVLILRAGGGDALATLIAPGSPLHGAEMLQDEAGHWVLGAELG